MARLASVGFELNSIVGGMELPAVSAGAPTISSSIFHGGAYSMRVTSLTTATAKCARLLFAGAAANGPYYCRVYFYVATAPSAENQFVQLNDTNASTTPVIYVTIDNSRVLRLYDEDGVIGSASSAVAADTWHYVEIEVDRTPAAGSQVVKAKLNGTEFAASTTRNLSSGVACFNFGLNLGSEANTAGDVYFDDAAVNDNTGSYQNTYAGAGSILFLRPNAAGDNSAWTGSYTDIDEITPDDATTLVSSNTLDQVIDVNIENTPAAIGSGDVINYVAVGFRNNVADATGSDPRFAVRLKAVSSGTVDESAATVADQTGWRTQNDGALTANYKALTNNSNYEQPGGSTAWTKAALDTAQIGARITVGDTHAAQITALWLLVEYKVGSNNYTQSVSGGTTPAGTLIKDSRKLPSGGLTPSGAASKASTKTFGGGITPSGLSVKEISKLLSGALSSIVGTLDTARVFLISLSGGVTPSGVKSSQTNKLPSGSLTSSGTISKASAKVFSGGSTPSGSVNKLIGKSFSGTITSLGSLLKLTSKFLSGVLTLTGELVADLTSGSQTFFQSLSGTLGFGGTATKSTSKLDSGSITSSGTINKRTTRELTGSSAPSGSLSLTKAFIKFLAGVVTLAGEMTKSTNKNTSGAITSGGDISKSTSKNLDSQLSMFGTISKGISKLLSGILNFIGTLIPLPGNLITPPDRVYLDGILEYEISLEGIRETTLTLNGIRNYYIKLLGKK